MVCGISIDSNPFAMDLLLKPFFKMCPFEESSTTSDSVAVLDLLGIAISFSLLAPNLIRWDSPQWWSLLLEECYHLCVNVFLGYCYYPQNVQMHVLKIGIG